jgi:archaellum component FlaC
MTNQQLYLLIAVPLLGNAVMFGLLMAYINAKFDSVNERFNSVNERFNSVNERFNGVNERFVGINQRFDEIDRRFEGIDRRFDDMRDLWRAELHRVEEVLDARLKHLEER